MKTLVTLFISIFFLISMEGIHGQTGHGGTVVPLKPNSILFGKDIILYDSLNVDQEGVAICSAFNGWLYAVVTYYDSVINNMPGFSLMRSTDNGITWNFLYGGIYPINYVKLHSNIVVALGDSVSNLKIFWSSLYTSITTPGTGQASIWRFDGETGAYEAQLYSFNAQSDIAIASDYNYQASNSSHPTLGMVCSTPAQIIFRSSSNGGMSFDNTQVVATTSNYYFHKVALNYGRSPSYPTGRYFAAWEAQPNQTSTIGHIYTAHSEPNFNSAFTKPVCIDSIDQSTNNKVRNPKIACQFSGADNDSANLTEVVMAEKQLSLNNYDTRGFYNLQATTSNHFSEFSISSSSNNKTQSDINFNPYNSTFMLTYYDSTLRSLPFLTNNVNLTNPGTWNIISSAYNDNGNLGSPLPKIDLNYLQQAGMDAWISKGSNGNGIALFDASYSTYTGVSEINSDDIARLIGAYPNPCSNYVKISFEVKKTENVTINLMSILGQPLGTITNQTYSEGKHVVQYDVSGFPQGTYLYNFRAGEFAASGKIFIIR
jgi:hypothetical protein